MRIPRLAIAGVSILLAFARVEPTTAEAAQLCIVPVPLRYPDDPFARRFLTHYSRARVFPASPWPLFAQAGAPGPLTWVLNEQGQLERPAGFPIDLDSFVTEPFGRVIGFWGATDRKQVYVQDAASGRFVGLDGTDKKTIGVVSKAAWISSLRATLIGTSDGVFALEGEGPTLLLRPLEFTGAVRLRNVGWIYDLPIHGAAVVGIYDGSVFILNSDNRLREVPGFQIPAHNWGARFGEVEHPSRLLIQVKGQTWTVPLLREGDTTIPGLARRITSPKSGTAGLQYYSAVRQYLVYGTPDRWFSFSPALLRLEDDLVAVEGSRALQDHPFIQDVPSRNFVVVKTFGRLYAYDGKTALKPIPGSSEAEIGLYPWVHDLASQNKVIVKTISGLYELTLEGRLDRLPLPSELEGAKFHELVEMPASHLAVVFTDRGAFGLDAAGALARVRGEHGIDFGVAGPELIAHIPVRETLFISTFRSGQFMILDEDKAGNEACAGGR
jgi:hypothetical protein